MTKRGDAGPVRVGVIGCGVIAYWVHLRLLQKMKGVQLAVASDPSPQARDKARQIIKAPVVERADEIFSNPKVDAVVICAPTGWHARLAVTALNAGKHVFIEKPIAATALDAQRVIDAATASGLRAAVGFSRRLHPLFEQAKNMIARGDLGAIHAVQSAFCEPMIAEEMSSWRQNRDSGGGVLLDLGSHHFDLVRWFLEQDVASVDCSIDSAVTSGDTARVSLQMSNRATVQSFFSYRTARADYLQFIGERGTMLLDRHRPTLDVRIARRWGGYGTRRRIVTPNAAVAKWRVARLASPSKEPSYRRALESFVGSIRGETPRGATLEDAARSLDVVLAAEESAAAGKRITLAV